MPSSFSLQNSIRTLKVWTCSEKMSTKEVACPGFVTQTPSSPGSLQWPTQFLHDPYSLVKDCAVILWGPLNSAGSWASPELFMSLVVQYLLCNRCPEVRLVRSKGLGLKIHLFDSLQGKVVFKVVKNWNVFSELCLVGFSVCFCLGFWVFQS